MITRNHRIIIVGAGMSGLTAAVYLSRAGYDVLLLEKGHDVGGLLKSIQRDGFVFDVGARSIENAGVIRPMLKDLGIPLELVKSPVSLGVEKHILNIQSLAQLTDYKQLLIQLYPENTAEIEKIIAFIDKVLQDMAVLYGIDNPYFRDLKHDKNFVMKELLPWMRKFIFTIMRINRMQEPVENFLKQMSSNRSLIDIIDQHFFKNTPVFFALGYFYVYLDYLYPKGGTGEFPKVLSRKIIEWGGKIQTTTEITQVNPREKKVIDSKGISYFYDDLIWAADLKTLYRILYTDGLSAKILRNITVQKQLILSKRGGDSVFSLMVGVNELPQTLHAISNGHFFYTPSKQGLNESHRSIVKNLVNNFKNTPKDQIIKWVEEYCRLTTYEISIPVFRDSSLAPPGKTGMIISFLFEYDLIQNVQAAGWYDEFKKVVEQNILKTLSESIYPGIENKILFKFSSTPLNIAKEAGTSEGAITGWSYETPTPVVNQLQKMASAIKTPIPDILQTGQWAYSPAGIPTVILTGWLAAQAIIKKK